MKKFLELARKIISAKSAIIGLVAITAFVSSYLIMQRTQTWLTSAREVQIKAETIQKMAPLKRIVGFKIDDLKSQIVKFALDRKSRREQLNFNDFSVMALVQKTGAAYNVKWHELGNQASELGWAADYDLTVIQALPLSKIHEGEVAWLRLVDVNNKPYFAMIVDVEVHNKDVNKRGFLVGITQQNLFSGILDDYLGSVTNVYVMNDKGYVAAHTDKSFAGTLMKDDPIFKDISHTSRSAVFGNFDDLTGQPVFAYYEKLEHSNLYAVISSPRSVAAEFLNNHWKAGEPSMFGVIALFGALAFLLTKLLSLAGEASPLAPASTGRESAMGLADLDFTDENPAKNDSEALKKDVAAKGLAMSQPEQAVVTQTPSDVGRFELLREMGRGMSEILAERIGGILGHVQLVLLKSKDEDVLSHAKVIESDARKSRDLIKQIEDFSSLPLTVVDTCDLNQLVDAAMQKSRVKIEDANIKVEVDLAPQVMVAASIEKFGVALDEILNNSIEALRGRDHKLITIRSSFESGRVRLAIGDNGVGMAKNVQAKMFTPFYRAFTNADGNGLGLARVHGIVSAHNGQLEVQSSPGVGTKVVITLAAFKEREAGEQLPEALKVSMASSGKEQKSEIFKSTAFNLDFLDDDEVDVPTPPPLNRDVFEVDEEDVDRDFYDQLKLVTVQAEDLAKANKDLEDEDEFMTEIKIRKPKRAPPETKA